MSSESSNTDKRLHRDDEIYPSSKRKRIRSRKACDRCHQKKVRCDFQSPCSTCNAAGVPDKCEYLKVEKPVYLNVRKDYVEGLVREVEQLKKQLAIVTAHLLDQPGVPERKMMESKTGFATRSANNPMSLTSILDNGAIAGPNGNPLVADQNLPHARSHFTYMGDSACSKFNTKLQQYVLFYRNEDLPQLRLIGSNPPPKFEDDDLHWNNSDISDGYCLPNKSEAHTLIDIAFKFVGVEYYLASLHSFGLLVDKIYENYKPGKKIRSTPNKNVGRSQMAQFFAMCALGSLYSGSIADQKYKVPGTEFFKIAVALLRDEFENPTIDYIEALSQVGFYSYALNRLSSTFVYTGLALRIALSMGLHRRASFWNNTSLDLLGRERGRRLFYTLFIFDRLICAKLGHPVSIDEEDIDTELPSEIFFTELEYREFPNSKYMLAQIEIANLSSLIVTNIYGINQLQSQENKKNFVYNVHAILSRLKECYDNLDPTLKLQHYNNQSLDNVLRNIFSFHMHYNQLIILATRPLLLYVFTRALTDSNFIPSQITSAIGDACIQSAYTINTVISTLYRTGKISSFGYFDAHYCFSSTIILIISKSLTNFDETTKLEIEGRIEKANNILKSLSLLGSLPARQFSKELQNLLNTFENIDQSKVAKVFTRSETESFSQPPYPEVGKLNAQESIPASIQYDNGIQSGILQIPNSFALDDEILQDFLNANFKPSLESSSTSNFQDAFKLDDFDQIDSILQTLRE